MNRKFACFARNSLSRTRKWAHDSLPAKNHTASDSGLNAPKGYGLFKTRLVITATSRNTASSIPTIKNNGGGKENNNSMWLKQIWVVPAHQQALLNPMGSRHFGIRR